MFVLPWAARISFQNKGKSCVALMKKVTFRALFADGGCLFEKGAKKGVKKLSVPGAS